MLSKGAPAPIDNALPEYHFRVLSYHHLWQSYSLRRAIILVNRIHFYTTEMKWCMHPLLVRLLGLSPIHHFDRWLQLIINHCKAVFNIMDVCIKMRCIGMLVYVAHNAVLSMQPVSVVRLMIAKHLWGRCPITNTHCEAACGLSYVTCIVVVSGCPNAEVTMPQWFAHCGRCICSLVWKISYWISGNWLLLVTHQIFIFWFLPVILPDKSASYS